MTSPDILEQGRIRREEDKLRPQRILQKEQQQFELKKHRKTLIIAIIAIIISALSLLFNILIYYEIIPNHKSTENPREQQESTKANHAKIYDIE